jgi:hypothetical protein
MKQRLKVKVTRVRRQRISMPAVPLRALCNDCGREVETLNTFQATEILEVEDQVLDALILTRHLHAFVTVSGKLRICKDSFLQREALTKLNRALDSHQQKRLSEAID